MDSLLAWSQWQEWHRNGVHRSRETSHVYPWSVFRFLTETGKDRLEDYTSQDVARFVSRPTLSPFERSHYKKALDAFFVWCRERSLIASNGTSPQRGFVRSSIERHGLLRGVVAAFLTPEFEPLPGAGRPLNSTVTIPGQALTRRAPRLRRNSGERPSSPLRSVLRLAAVVLSVVVLEVAAAVWAVARFSG
jgi:hypothetical protein